MGFGPLEQHVSGRPLPQGPLLARTLIIPEKALPDCSVWCFSTGPGAMVSCVRWI